MMHVLDQKVFQDIFCPVWSIVWVRATRPLLLPKVQNFCFAYFGLCSVWQPNWQLFISKKYIFSQLLKPTDKNWPCRTNWHDLLSLSLSLCTCVCVILEHISGGAGVQQQPVGALRGRPGPGGGTLCAARAQHRRLAHIQPVGLLQPGSASLCHHRLPTTTCVLCHILWRLVKK